MDKDSKQVVVLLTHPNIKESRANKALMDAISDMGEVAIYNLYEMRVEDAFNAEIWSTIISHASALVFQFPFYWMSAPSLLKRWLDEVFTYLEKTPAVAGKTLMVVTTAGSEHDAYRSDAVHASEGIIVSMKPNHLLFLIQMFYKYSIAQMSFSSLETDPF